MSKRPWYKRYPSDFVNGTMRLSAEEKGVYATIIDMIYDAGGPIENSPQDLARICGCSTRKFNIILAALVDKHRKLTLSEEGLIGNRRAENQMAEEGREHKDLGNNARLSHEKRRENRRKKQEKSSEKYVPPAKNNDLAENPHLHARPHSRSQSKENTPQPEESPPPREAAADPPSDGRKSWTAFIELVDEIETEVFGPQRRQWPAGTDAGTAIAWEQRGWTPDQVAPAIEQVCQRTRERDGPAPKSLSYFTGAIEQHLRAIEDGKTSTPRGGSPGPYRPPEEGGYEPPPQLDPDDVRRMATDNFRLMGHFGKMFPHATEIGFTEAMAEAELERRKAEKEGQIN